jgi:hypothetical protein
MTNTDITGLLNQLEIHEQKACAVLSMIDGNYSLSLIRAALEELYTSAESLKLGVSLFEKP